MKSSAATKTSLRQAKRAGRRLREAREFQGQNLAILASRCNLSVVQITAIERDDNLPFDRDPQRLLEARAVYASALGVDIEAFESVETSFMPAFLRKKE